MAVYIHMMTCASSQPNATERGRTIGWCDEDIATALDLETSQIVAIRDAMQGRVMDGDKLSGWDRRQSVREDEGAASRAKAWREKEKAKKEALEAAAKALENANRTQPNATERNRTTEVDVEVEIEVDKKSPKVKSNVPPSGVTAEIFAYWQKIMNHPLAKLDAKRSKAIKARLADGYTVEQICKAVDGCKLSPHHMGQNESQTVYDDIELICRDVPKLEKFMGWAARGPVQPKQDEKFFLGGVDRSGDALAMAESMRKHNIASPAPDDPINF